MTRTSTANIIDTLRADNADLRERLGKTSRELAQCKAQIAWFQRQLFGQRSEKLSTITDLQQGWLFSSNDDAPPSDKQPETDTITITRRRKFRDNAVTDSGLRFDPDVPVKVIRAALPEGVTEDDVIDWRRTHRLAQSKSDYIVIEHQHPVIKDPETAEVTSVPAPAGLFPGSFADVSFIAGMLIDKYLYHRPLNRQHQRLEQAGITISRSGMVTLANRGIDLLDPIAEALLEIILESAVLTVDETPIKVGPGVDGKLKQGWLWPIHGEDGEIFFLFDPGRGTTVISNVIPEDFQGVLLTDGYTVYSRLARMRPNFIHAVCWLHTRRKFVDAIKTEQAAQECLLHIREMYRQEALIRKEGLEGEEKRAARRARCLPAAEAFWAVCDSVMQRTDLEPSHPLMKAVGYACKRRNELMVCFNNPDVPLDTNHVERANRPVAMGKRNWLFAGNEEGARRIGIIQSLLASCRLQGIDPRTWLIDVLQRVGCHPASRVHELTPRLWKQHFADCPLGSDVDTS